MTFCSLVGRARVGARGRHHSKLFFFAAICIGCSPSSGAPSGNASSAVEAGAAGADAPGADAASSCDPSFHPDIIAPGLTKQGANGVLTFELRSVDQIPPVAKYNTWTLRLTDANGNPVVDASAPSIKTWMPLHMHPSSVVPTWKSNGDGTYETSVFLFMPGLWQVTFQVQSGMTTDSVMYTFCVGG